MDKHGLIHISSCPPMLDERLAKWVEKALPLAICLHGIFGAATYQVRWCVACVLCSMCAVTDCRIGQGSVATAMMAVASVLAVIFLILFECWETCKEEEPPQDINMAVPYQHFWAHAPCVAPLLLFHPLADFALCCSGLLTPSPLFTRFAMLLTGLSATCLVSLAT